MYRPTVFLSHSTKGDPGALVMRHQLESELTARGWQVLVDEDGLRGGEDWRGVLYHWIADCDAAVVLMSDRALASDWVRREINLLLWRRALGSPLTIVPAMLSPTRDTGAPELRDLRELQFVSNDATPKSFAGAIAGRLPDLSAPVTDTTDRMRHWLIDVVSCLRDVTEHEPLRAAVEALDAHQDDWDFPSVREAQRFLAHWLLGPMHSARIHTAMEHIARPVSGKLGQLVGLVMPAWVDGEAARALLPEQHRTCAVLNARYPETAKQYVRRAACCSLSYRTKEVSAVVGEGLATELLRDCLDAVRELLDLPPGMELEDDDEPLDGQVCFLLINPNHAPLAPVAGVVRTLLERFRWLNVIVLTGESTAGRPQLDEWRLAEAIVLPALGAGQEKLASRVTRRLLALQQEIAS
ncbi:toll/interleukin-1 receptor domain-containing protein [Lentzea sp. BCCO 10_0856]|uniref:Toll/interleukin-1 receptor domain-containing protein n=1 Tax=Lentzea miocenica TaxID=3095431 RepID=A0ABU4SS10_9PSEU|nr:toll/interleukin-1 receptor domain-containing protein [Lentzea sp. BCCO 10_0856]MDX8028684.1 toll/interleukin-1 receptor domain-containing protein [Lentzea sp. BCCO 10_0856]